MEWWKVEDGWWKMDDERQVTQIERLIFVIIDIGCHIEPESHSKSHWNIT